MSSVTFTGPSHTHTRVDPSQTFIRPAYTTFYHLCPPTCSELILPHCVRYVSLSHISILNAEASLWIFFCTCNLCTEGDADALAVGDTKAATRLPFRHFSRFRFHCGEEHFDNGEIDSFFTLKTPRRFQSDVRPSIIESHSADGGSAPRWFEAKRWLPARTQKSVIQHAYKDDFDVRWPNGSSAESCTQKYATEPPYNAQVC